jgi:polysaccharide biosynthesis/export protein
MVKKSTTIVFSLAFLTCGVVAVAQAQQRPTTQPAPSPRPAAPTSAQPAPTPRPAPTSVPVVTGPVAQLPSDYVIGAEDVLGVLFWREPDMNGDVTVRPDGMITLPLLGDIRVVGLKPEALKVELQKVAGKFLSDPNATVVVRQINSRKVFITGEVRTPGAYPLTGPRNILQLISLAGGLNEYAKGDKIRVMRTEGASTRTFQFNYKDVSQGKKLEQNIQLQPGDTVVVP